MKAIIPIEQPQFDRLTQFIELPSFFEIIFDFAKVMFLCFISLVSIFFVIILPVILGMIISIIFI